MGLRNGFETAPMDELPLLNREDGDRLFQQVLAHFDAPAYVRRARRVQQAFDDLLAHCRRQRDDWTTMLVIRLGTLRMLAGTWDNLAPHLASDEQVDALERLWEVLKPELQVRFEPTNNEKRLRRELVQLVSEVEALNRRWTAFLPTVDLSQVNRLRADYNRYYVLEKECAVRSAVVVRHGFRPLSPLTPADLAEALPELPVPRLRES